MGDEFEIKDLGNLKYFVRSKKCMFASQRKYTVDLLTETSMLRYRIADTPIEFNCKLGNSVFLYFIIFSSYVCSWYINSLSLIDS